MHVCRQCYFSVQFKQRTCQISLTALGTLVTCLHFDVVLARYLNEQRGDQFISFVLSYCFKGMLYIAWNGFVSGESFKTVQISLMAVNLLILNRTVETFYHGVRLTIKLLCDSPS